MTKRPQEQPKPHETTHKMQVTMPGDGVGTPWRRNRGWNGKVKKGNLPRKTCNIMQLLSSICSLRYACKSHLEEFHFFFRMFSKPQMFLLAGSSYCIHLYLWKPRQPGEAVLEAPVLDPAVFQLVRLTYPLVISLFAIENGCPWKRGWKRGCTV